MSSHEIAFPVLGAAFVVLCVLPIAALLAKVVLMWLERDGRGAMHGLDARYVVLTCSTFLPLAWFVSAGLHQAESGRSAMSCLFDHAAAAEPCFEAAAFASALLFALAFAVWRSNSPERLALAPSVRAEQTRVRLQALTARVPALRGLRGRVHVTEAEGFALGTAGLLRPYVIVGARYAEQLSEVALGSALAHEAEHVAARDPLRYLALEVALALNPIGRLWLAPHAASFRAAREAHCDREAVVRGAEPLALAEALICAARPVRSMSLTHAAPAVPLGATDTRLLALRVGFLIAFAEHAPARCCAHAATSSLRTALVLLALVLLLPHGTSTAALDALHTGTERAVTHLLP